MWIHPIARQHVPQILYAPIKFAAIESATVQSARKLRQMLDGMLIAFVLAMRKRFTLGNLSKIFNRPFGWRSWLTLIIAARWWIIWRVPLGVQHLPTGHKCYGDGPHAHRRANGNFEHVGFNPSCDQRR